MDDDRRSTSSEPQYVGLRMTAADYAALPDDDFKYELIDGVVVMSPSPTFGHQDIAGEIESQIRAFLRRHPIGRVVRETDVTLDPIRVYRPDLVFLSNERVPRRDERIRAIPNVIVEVLSPASRAMDLSTKRDDYERFGVSEYWIVDPDAGTLTFLRLPEASEVKSLRTRVAKGARPVKGRYQTVNVKGGKFRSAAIPGFTLDIAAVKLAMSG